MWTYEELAEAIQFPEAIDSTMLSAFGSCPTKFFQEFVIRRVPVGRSIDLHAGGAIARACEVIRLQVFKHGISLEAAKEIAWAEFLANWPLGLDPKEGSYKDFVNCWAAVEAYFEKYPPREDYFQPYIQADGSPTVEFRFGIPTAVVHPTTGDPILFAGRADMLVQNEPGSCYVLDEKTTKAMGPSWPYQWAMRGQFYGYNWAARAYELPCVGAVVRGICIQQTQFQFAEHTMLINSEQRDRWHANMTRRLKQMVYCFENTQLVMYTARKEGWEMDMLFEAIRNCWDMSWGDACTSYGGCRFSDLCVSARPQDTYHGWETRVWNPLDQDPTKDSEDRQSGMEEMTLAELMGYE